MEIDDEMERAGSLRTPVLLAAYRTVHHIIDTN
jgi:hypothetical protein